MIAADIEQAVAFLYKELEEMPNLRVGRLTLADLAVAVSKVKRE